MADTTGKLPGGILSIVICVVLMMAIVIPVTNGMAASIESGVYEGSNDLKEDYNPMIYVESMEMTVERLGVANNRVTIDGRGPTIGPVPEGDLRDAPADLAVFYLYSAGLTLKVTDMSAYIVADGVDEPYIMALPLTVSLANGRMTVTGEVDGELDDDYERTWELRTPGALFTYSERFDIPATHAQADLPVLVGHQQAIVMASGSVQENLWFYGGSAHVIDNGLAVPTEYTDETVDGGAVMRVSEIDGNYLDIFYAPLEWHAEDQNAIILKLLVSIVPLVLAAALISLLAFWMFPDAKIGRKDETFTSR